MNYLAWEDFKKFYNEKFGASDEIVELIASIDILRLCSFGLSNSHIAKLLDIKEEHVITTIDYYFNFLGYDKDLDLNPYNIYQNNKDYASFKNELRIFSNLIVDNTIEMCYNICVTYEQLRKELDKFYGTN